MSENFITKFKEWDSFYGKFLTWVFRLFLSVSLLAGKLYIDNHYVDKPHFDKAMSTLADDKARYAVEQKQELKEINGKLDAILQSGAANSQRFNDTERRLSRLEDKADR